MRLALVILAGLPLLLAAPAAWVLGEAQAAAAALAGAFACAAGGVLAFHLPTTARREPRAGLHGLAALAAAGGWAHALAYLLAPLAFAPGASLDVLLLAVPPLRLAGLPLAAGAFVAMAALVAAGRARGAVGGPHRGTLLAAGTLLLAGFAALVVATAATPFAAAPDLVAVWVGAWCLAGLALVAPRLLKRPAPAFPLHAAALVLAAVPATWALPEVPGVRDLAAGTALAAAAALALVALAPASRARPEKPGPLLPQADALAAAGLLLLIAALVPALDAAFVVAVGLACLAASLTLLLAPVLANQTPRDPRWARAAAGVAVAAAVATAVDPRAAASLALVAGAAFAWTTAKLARPRRVCPPDAVLPE